MLNRNNTKTKSVLLVVVALFSTAMILGPAISSIDTVSAKQKYKNWSDCREDHSKNWCKKYFKKHDNDDNKNNGGGGNKASQGIGQSQSSSQNSQVVSGGNTFGSGNNFNFQNQVNTGNNALAQQ